MSRGRLALVTVGALVIAAWALDGPFWLLLQPSGLDSSVRSATARLHSWRGSTRARAADDLRALGPRAVVAAPSLIEHLNDTGWTNFHQGLSTMFAFHGGSSIVRTNAGLALEAMGSGAVPALIIGMSNPSEQVRMFAAELLGQAGDPRALPVLRAAVLSDPSASVQNSAAKSLYHLHDRSLFDQVAARLHDTNPDRRLMAAGLVESLAGADAIPVLREAATSNPDAKVRRLAELMIVEASRER